MKERDTELIDKAMSILKDNAWKRNGASGVRLAKQMGCSPQLLGNYRSKYNKPLTTNMAARIVAAFEELTAKDKGNNNEDGD